MRTFQFCQDNGDWYKLSCPPELSIEAGDIGKGKLFLIDMWANLALKYQDSILLWSDRHAYDDVFPSLTLSISDRKISCGSDYHQVRQVLSSLLTLDDNWDGEGAVAPSKQVVSNAIAFLNVLEKERFKSPKEEDVDITPYGSIVFDFKSEKGLISVEIGRKKIGFFTDFKDGHNYATEGIECDFTFIPKSLSLVLE